VRCGPITKREAVLELHGITLILDNYESAYRLVQEVVRDHWEEGARAVGDAIIEAFEPSEDQLGEIGFALWREFMSNVDAVELGEYYLDDFDPGEE
jgi:hypothetical protein